MILVCGESLVDLLVAPEPGGTSSLDARLGGAPFNLAIGLARLGQHVALFSGVSTDPFGEAIVQRLAKEGVGLNLLQRSDGATMLAIVGVGQNGDASYFFPIADGADKRLSMPVLPEGSAFVAAAFGSYLAMIEPAASLMRDVAQRLRPDSVICLDPNVRLSMVADPDLWRQGIERFLPLADIVKVSEEDVQLVYGAGADSLQVAEGWLARGTIAGRRDAWPQGERGDFRQRQERHGLAAERGRGGYGRSRGRILCRPDRRAGEAPALVA